MSRLYPTDTNPRFGYQRTPRVPGPFMGEEKPLRFGYIAAPIIGTAAYLVMALGWVS